MAAPAVSRRYTFRFRDAKGNVAHVRCLIGGANVAAVDADAVTLLTHFTALSNAHVSRVDAALPDFTYGTPGTTYETVEDKAAMTYLSQQGTLHRFQFPAPQQAAFLADQETVDPTATNIALINTDFATFVYATSFDTAPLAYVGGIRVRRKFQRKFNVFTLNPAESGPGE